MSDCPALQIKSDRPPPTKAYKFFQWKDVKRVCEERTIWLTDAETVRRQYEGRAGYGDALEAASDWSIGREPQLISTGHSLLQGLPLARPVQLVGAVGGTTLRSAAQCGLFCVSGTNTERIQWRMIRDFRHDAYFEIHDLLGLFRQIVTAVGAAGFAGKVEYVDPERRDPQQFKVDPFRKATAYRWQDEVRLVFPNIKGGRAITVPELDKFIGPIRPIPRRRRYTP